MVSTVKIVIVDDQVLVRKGIRLLLDAEPEFSVLTDLDNDPAAADEIVRLQPDIVVIDIAVIDITQNLNGLELLRRLSNSAPHIHAVMLSSSPDISLVRQSFRDGAYGYVHKSADSGWLMEAIRAATQSQRFVSPPFSLAALEAADEETQPTVNAASGLSSTLSKRERQVLQLVVQGYSSRQIGDHLSISPRTVEVHRTKLMRKLNLRRHVDLIRFAVREGLVSLES